jgi:hypothetical protein
MDGTDDFLIGLKDKFDGSRNFAFVFRQNFSGYQQHGHVGIMTAGMHVALV